MIGLRIRFQQNAQFFFVKQLQSSNSIFDYVYEDPTDRFGWQRACVGSRIA